MFQESAQITVTRRLKICSKLEESLQIMKAEPTCIHRPVDFLQGGFQQHLLQQLGQANMAHTCTELLKGLKEQFRFLAVILQQRIIEGTADMFGSKRRQIVSCKTENGTTERRHQGNIQAGIVNYLQNGMKGRYLLGFQQIHTSTGCIANAHPLQCLLIIDSG